MESVNVELFFTGATLGVKGRSRYLTPRAVVSTREHKVVYKNLDGEADEEWVFTPSRVYKLLADGEMIAERKNPRAAFAGHNRSTPWDDLHLLYFTGYAIWQYINFPYFLAQDGYKTRELSPHHELGQTWRRLEVTFPDSADFAFHNKVQTYYFDEKFHLRRHDYAADVIGGHPAAHYTHDEISVDGMLFPTFRRVVAISEGADGQAIPLLNGPIPTLIHLVFCEIKPIQAADA